MCSSEQHQWSRQSFELLLGESERVDNKAKLEESANASEQWKVRGRKKRFDILRSYGGDMNVEFSFVQLSSIFIFFLNFLPHTTLLFSFFRFFVGDINKTMAIHARDLSSCFVSMRKAFNLTSVPFSANISTTFFSFSSFALFSSSLHLRWNVYKYYRHFQGGSSACLNNSAG